MEENKSDKKSESKYLTLKNPYIITLICILALALIIRVYFVYHTPGQTLWWDEAEYMSTANHWAFGVPYDLNPQRPPLFQFLAAVLLMAGAGEIAIRLLLVVVPSVLLVYSLYLLGKEMYSKETGLIAAFLGVASWTFLFWTNRVQPDFFSMAFSVLAIYFMWKHWKQPSVKNVLLSGFFAALGFYFKVSALLVPMIFIVFLLVKDRLAAFKDKHYYYFSAAFITTLIPYFIWSYITFGTPFAFRAGYSNAIGTSIPFGWYNIGYYYALTEGLTFVLFIIGLIIGLKFIFYLDVLAKDKKRCFNPDLFGIIAFIVTSAFYIFYIRYTDDRWVFIWIPFIFFFVGQALEKIYKWISKKNVLAAFAIVLLLLAFCAYSQVSQASSLIDMKKDSYAPVKDAALWIKANSNRTDSVFSVSLTQTTYYTEDNVSTYSLVPQLANATEFDKMVLADKPRYITWSIFEQHPNWTVDWMTGHIAKKDVNIVYGVAADASQTQPALLIFAPDYKRFS